MPIADIFPLAPDYGIESVRDASGILEFRAESGQVFQRQSRALAWNWNIPFLDRSRAERDQAEAFAASHAADVFTLRDSITPRDYTVRLVGQPSYRELGYERFEIQARFEEAVGELVLTPPQGPLAVVDPAGAGNDGTGVTITYYGYGFSAVGVSGLSVTVDGQATALNPTAPQEFNLGLGYHTVRLEGEFASFGAFSYVV